jgi:hypothetical protein
MIVRTLVQISRFVVGTLHPFSSGSALTVQRPGKSAIPNAVRTDSNPGDLQRATPWVRL